MNGISELRLRNNPGVTISRLPDDVFDALKVDVDRAITASRDFNDQLIGQIEEEYRINLDRKVLQHLSQVVQDYQTRFVYSQGKRPLFSSYWLNRQKKHEYNPVHRHFNALGWVIWVNIPYDIEAEMNHANSAKTRMKRNSAFEFVYSSLSGEIQTHPIMVSKDDEGTLLLFPKGLRHVVYPFYTSDDYRISVAGNIDLV